MLDTSTRPRDEGRDALRETVRRFIARELDPHSAEWEKAGIVPREAWRKAGAAGLLSPSVPGQYGGPGLDFGYNAAIIEELAYAGANTGFTAHSDVIVEYLVHYGSPEQRERWLPGTVSGEVITAVAMTEPGTGSDLKAITTTARRDGNHYVLNGAKTYITNGGQADLIILVAKTDPDAGAKGISLILVEADREGFSRGKHLDKIGQKAIDTAELFFADLRVPITNCLGEEGKGFAYLMQQLPQERLVIAVGAQAAAQRALDEAVTFTKERKAFGGTVFDFQNTRFTLAALATKIQVGWAHIDWAVARHIAGELTAAEASAAKLFHSELAWETVDAAAQLHGGAGYINDYAIARLWRDTRIHRIYGGTSEIMKEVVARAL